MLVCTHCAPLLRISTTGAVPAMKPEATAIGNPQDGRRKITLTFDGRRFCIPTRQWRHWGFRTTSCFGVTNHSEAASLRLVRQDWATINSGSPPSCGAPFWQWSVASPCELGWLASKVSRYLSILCLWVAPSGSEVCRVLCRYQSSVCWSTSCRSWRSWRWCCRLTRRGVAPSGGEVCRVLCRYQSSVCWSTSCRSSRSWRWWWRRSRRPCG